MLLAYEWTAFVLERFPYTRPWGEALFDNLVARAGRIRRRDLKAVPGLMFVALIILLTRIIVRAVRAFFDGVHRGSIKVGLLDETTARPTGQLVITGIWILALVAAYPYIPGSESEAFKGIGVFVGLMLSLGASGIVNQAVSGLMLMYTRALRPGEFVQIGEYEGTVKSVGFVTTRIETLRHEEVNIPNAVIATSVTRNYSRLAADGGLWIATKVTIGYDTPWRQVHAMLELAAARTEGIEKDPAPRVRQTALQDFYVEYTLLVCIADPQQRVVTLGQAAREHPGRLQRVRRADHVAQLRGRPRVAQGRAARQVVRAARGRASGSEGVAHVLDVVALERGLAIEAAAGERRELQPAELDRRAALLALAVDPSRHAQQRRLDRAQFVAGRGRSRRGSRRPSGPRTIRLRARAPRSRSARTARSRS